MRQQRRTREQVADLDVRLGPGPWSTAALREAGMSPSSLRRAVEAGRLVRVRRGVLARPGDAFPTPSGPASQDAPPPAGDGGRRSTRSALRPGAASPEALGRAVPDAGQAGRPSGPSATDLRVRARAALLTARDDAVLSHGTAAAWWGLWLPTCVRPEAEPVHLTLPGVHDRVSGGVRVHGSPLLPGQVEFVDGVRVTSVARTGVDVARGLRLPDALVVLDAAARCLAARTGALGEFRDPGHRVRALAVASAQLAAAVDLQAGWPGIAAVRAALAHVDLGSESPFESSSRGHLLGAGLPVPEIGCAVRGASGTWYVADFLWRAHRLVGEADGLGKYGVGEREVRERLAAERHRQRDLEDAGWRVARWDTREPVPVWLARLARLLSVEPA